MEQKLTLTKEQIEGLKETIKANRRKAEKFWVIIIFIAIILFVLFFYGRQTLKGELGYESYSGYVVFVSGIFFGVVLTLVYQHFKRILKE